MKFISRSLVALFILSITAALLVFAGAQVFWAVQESQEDQRRTRPQRERVFTVNVETFTPETITPEITTYGYVLSWRSTELRTIVAGSLVGLSPNFRDGGSVTQGQTLFEINPAKFESSLTLAENSLREAQIELSDAQNAVALVEAEVELAEKQRVPRDAAYQRQLLLKERGVGTDTDVEAAALALFSADQALINQQQALASAETRIQRAEIAVTRQQISVEEAARLLAETSIVAPFDGVVSNVNAIQGQLVSTNEKLGDLIDPEALEVSFRLSNTRFGRLLDESGAIQQLPVDISFDLNGLPFALSGVIDRAGAEVGDGQTGRLVYARLAGAGISILRPGDFLTVKIAESPIENVSVVPAASVDDEGNMLIIGEGDRLEEIAVEVLRRQTEGLIVSGIPFGRQYVTSITPQIGKGIQVRPLSGAPEESTEEPRAGRPPEAETSEPEVITLDDERRAKLLAFVEGNQRMPAEAKTRIIAQLSEPEVPKDVVERLEQRMNR